jgi:Tfp pilus assembly protein PilN
MHSIDLIPADYRRARWLRVWARQLGITAAVMIGLSVVAFIGLQQRTESLQAEVKRLEEQQAVTAQQRTVLEDLSRRKASIAQQLSVLKGLRSGAPAQTVFRVVDEALVDAEVWFLDWKFQRAGMKSSQVPQAGVETGYFVMVPDAAVATSDQPWLIETHMTIEGQARDYKALSKFVNGLFAHAAVVDVKVQRTEMSKRNDKDVVQFEVAVVLNSEANG